MKGFLTLTLVVLAVLGIAGISHANICAFDPVPAATLLFPFVQYDYENPSTNTLFAITNLASKAQVVHVTLWTDYSAPILDFNILLTGYDVQTMTIRDILRDGNLPVTYHTLNNGGPWPNDDGPVSGSNVLNGDWVDRILDPPEPTGVLECTDGNPEDYEGGIPQAVLDLFQSWLQKSQTEDRYYSDDCGPVDPLPGFPESYILDEWWLDDDFNHNRPTWMYITADVVSRCNRIFPDNPAYFEVLGLDNVLIGDLIYFDADNQFSESYNAVHIEAVAEIGDTVTRRLVDDESVPITFYSRFANSQDVPPESRQDDYREPLPTAWAFRYLNDRDVQAETWVRVWKGSTNFRFPPDLSIDLPVESISEMVASNCLAYTYYAWDEAEDVTTVHWPGGPPPPGWNTVPNLLPLATQEVNVDHFVLPDSFGWLLFVWPASNYDGTAMLAPETPDYYQTWMGTRIQAFGTYSSAKDAHVLANYNCFSDQVLPNLGFGPIDGLRAEGMKPTRKNPKGLFGTSLDFLRNVYLEIRGHR